MPALLSFLMRLLAFAAALVFAAGMVLVTFVVGALWLLHSSWVRLGGRPVLAAFLSARLRGGRFGWPVGARPQRGVAPQGFRVPAADVTDVEAK